MKDDRKPQAFPYCGVGDELNYSKGMALRNYFAAKAMQALIAKGMEDPNNRNAKGVSIIAKFAYEYADAMLAEGAP